LALGAHRRHAFQAAKNPASDAMAARVPGAVPALMPPGARNAPARRVWCRWPSRERFASRQNQQVMNILPWIVQGVGPLTLSAIGAAVVFVLVFVVVERLRNGDFTS
jgi:hypothetical protein